MDFVQFYCRIHYLFGVLTNWEELGTKEIFLLPHTCCVHLSSSHRKISIDFEVDSVGEIGFSVCC